MRGHLATWRASRRPCASTLENKAILPQEVRSYHHLLGAWGEHGHGTSALGKPPAPTAPLPMTQGAANLLPVPTPSGSPTARPHTVSLTPQPSAWHNPRSGPSRPSASCPVSTTLRDYTGKNPRVFTQEPAPSPGVLLVGHHTPPKKGFFLPQKPRLCLAGQGQAGAPPRGARRRLTFTATRRPPGSDQRPPRGPREARPPPANGSGRAGGYLHPAGG